MRRIAEILALAAAAAGWAAWAAGCASPGGPAQRQDAASGRAFALRACAGCHAIGPGESANPHAPPFRTLAALLPGAALEDELAGIARRGHGEMPPIYMTPDEIAAVGAYVRAVAAPRRGLQGRRLRDSTEYRATR